MEGKHKLLDVTQAASYIGVTVKTLYQWTYLKKLTYHKVGRLVKFDLADLDKFIEKSKVKSIEKICAEI